MGAGNQETPLAGIAIGLLVIVAAIICLSGCAIIVKTVF